MLYRILSSIAGNDNEIDGYIVLDTRTEKAEKLPAEKVKALLRNNKNAICNAILKNGDVAFTECALDRIDIIKAGVKPEKPYKLIVVGRYRKPGVDDATNDVFKIADVNGGIITCRMEDAIKYGKTNGFQNAKLVPYTSSKHGYYIAALKGSLTVMNEKGLIGVEPVTSTKQVPSGDVPECKRQTKPIETKEYNSINLKKYTEEFGDDYLVVDMPISFIVEAFYCTDKFIGNDKERSKEWFRLIVTHDKLFDFAKNNMGAPKTFYYLDFSDIEKYINSGNKELRHIMYGLYCMANIVEDEYEQGSDAINDLVGSGKVFPLYLMNVINTETGKMQNSLKESGVYDRLDIFPGIKMRFDTLNKLIIDSTTKNGDTKENQAINKEKQDVGKEKQAVSKESKNAEETSVRKYTNSCRKRMTSLVKGLTPETFDTHPNIIKSKILARWKDDLGFDVVTYVIEGQEDNVYYATAKNFGKFKNNLQTANHARMFRTAKVIDVSSRGIVDIENVIKGKNKNIAKLLAKHAGGIEVLYRDYIANRSRKKEA